MRKPGPGPAAGAAMLFLALSSCGGPAHSDQASAPAAQSAAAPIASDAAVTPTGVATSAGASAASTGAPAGSAGAGAPSATKGGAASATKGAAASAAPIPGLVPLDLDKTAVYDDWNFGQASTGAIWLDIKDSSCNGVPNTSVTETPTSVTILVTAQLLHDGNPTCKSVPKTVGMLASILTPLGHRFLEGCRPTLEKAGRKINCRTGGVLVAARHSSR